MKIVSVEAAAVTDVRALGRSVVPPAAWHDEIDHMNPLADDSRYAGQARRFDPPWSEAICVVMTETGEWGMGMTEHAGPVVPLINDYLGPLLIGEPCADVERLWHMARDACAAHFGSTGLTSHALSAIDLALWDLRGKLLEVPVWELLGASPEREPLWCYATGLDIASYKAQGFEAFKVPCPWSADPTVALEEARLVVGTARELAGFDSHLMLDCWAVRQVEHAVALAESLAPFRLAWFEDCIDPENWPGYPDVRSRLPGVRLAAGERWYTERPFRWAVTGGWVDVVQPDPRWVGGITPTVMIAEAAAAGGVAIAVHCAANDAYGQHLAYGIEASRWAEMYIGGAPGASFTDTYRATPGMATPVAGRLVPSDAAGFGIELTLDDIDRATLS